ncbi:MAG: Dam family site-specific DNA-(adenine-N6)-methyltransferase [Acidobacteria bacterium]|nr:Dam family site-specific DNA-(adenine-N6)-methyltransferase [Acidobacteriota bacterium]
MRTVTTQRRAPLSVSDAPGPKPVRPFLKWAGGKRQLLSQLARFQPATFGAYCEPFLGSGALFFDLHNRGVLDDRRVVLMDNNADLIGSFLSVRNDVSRVIRSLKRLSDAHQLEPSVCYYRVRDQRFNPARRRLAPNDESTTRRSERYTPSLAAMLIYLNHTGFNGLFRLNSSGGFNVPEGRYVNPRICDASNLRAVSSALARPGVEVRENRFESVCEWARPGDFLYFDPPYAPTSATSSFTAYTPGGFSVDDQRRLQQIVVELARRGCHVLLSNSTAPEITALYADNVVARAAGLRAHRVTSRRAINSRGSARGLVDEYLISNIAPSSSAE